MFRITILRPWIVPILGIVLLFNNYLLAQTTIEVPTFDLDPVPAWVKSCEPDVNAKPADGNSGIHYLLVDEQHNLEPRSFYYHEARQICSENGVQNGASISTSFNPSYQKLILHFIRIIRDGVVTERLNRSQIKILQRERDLESFLYDGYYTAVCQLEDVRVKDIIEFAYSIDGDNPVMKGKYFNTISTEWSTPVHQSLSRIVFPESRILRFQENNASSIGKISTQNGVTEWIREEVKIPARQLDANTPRDYNPYGSVEISEFGTWSDLVDWAHPLYKIPEEPSDEISLEIKKLLVLPIGQSRILSALRFVQDEVRYLGFETGVGSHKPTAPQEVLRRRFGDCKDKTLLLATLLRGCGIEASPALVSTFRKSTVMERLPSPSVFNHVILRVEYMGEVWWLDATRSSQRGPLSQIYIGDYKFALVLKAGEIKPIPFSPTALSLPQKKITENYRIQPPGVNSTLEVITEYRGLSAERTRAYFQASTPGEIQKNYLQFYANRYPSIKAVDQLRYEEMPGEIGCRVSESYQIPSLWSLKEDQSQYNFFLSPIDIDSEMGAIGSEHRNDPLALSYPNQITQEIHAEMFKGWQFSTSNQKEENKFFRYIHQGYSHQNRIDLTYFYQTSVDRVQVAELPEFGAAHRKIKESVGYTFTHRDEKQMQSFQYNSPTIPKGFNWPVAIVYGVFVLLVVSAAIWFFFASRLRSPLPPSISHSRLDMISGWLILVAVGLFLKPFAFIGLFVKLWPTVFELQTWRVLTDSGQASYHPFWMPTLCFELFANTVMFVLSILLIVLFFGKRAAWPRCWALFLILVPINVIVDHLLAMKIPDAAANTSIETPQIMVQAIIQAAIWIPYAFMSKRVKATFRH
jgi:transglutaminase-like putative cysteine protease